MQRGNDEDDQGVSFIMNSLHLRAADNAFTLSALPYFLVGRQQP